MKVQRTVIYVLGAFGSRELKLVVSSLKDVKGVKGIKNYNELESFMASKSLPFVFFSSDFNSWPKAPPAANRLLK